MGQEKCLTDSAPVPGGFAGAVGVCFESFFDGSKIVGDFVNDVEFWLFVFHRVGVFFGLPILISL